MDIKNSSKTIVVVAHAFDPSVLKESWLKNYGIVLPGDILPESIFTDNFVQLVTNNFVIVATNKHIQIELISDQPVNDVRNVLNKIIDLLEHVNYQGVGINFQWELRSDGSNRELTKALFYSNMSPVFSIFDEADAYFGGYVSRDFLNGRMKLDMKPQHLVKAESQAIPDKLVFFGFNYHHDISLDFASNKKVLEILNDWEKYLLDSQNVINKIISKV